MLKTFLERIASIAPVFNVPPERVKFIKSGPSGFYQSVLEDIKTAKHRVILASLYIGDGALERDLVSIHLDHLRGTRKQDTLSSREMLEKSLKEPFPDQVTLSSIVFPETEGFWKRLLFSSRTREAIAVSHLKFIVADDAVILTGANLASLYFTNRFDRYIRIDGNERFANYYARLFGVLSNSRRSLADAVQEFIVRSKEDSETDTMIENLVKGNVLVFPTLQFGSRGVLQDQHVLFQYLDQYPTRSDLYFASGYFNPATPVADRLTRLPFKRVFVGSPASNGFHGAEGLAGLVPSFYQIYADSFINRLLKGTIQQFTKPNWSFHAKGLWRIAEEGEGLISSTVIGSSNYGERSFHRDFENQAYLFSSSAKFKSELEAEIQSLQSSSSDLISGKPAPFWHRILAQLCKRFL